jgi:hypothetical protein
MQRHFGIRKRESKERFLFGGNEQREINVVLICLGRTGRRRKDVPS